MERKEGYDWQSLQFSNTEDSCVGKEGEASDSSPLSQTPPDWFGGGRGGKGRGEEREGRRCKDSPRL